MGVDMILVCAMYPPAEDLWSNGSVTHEICGDRSTSGGHRR
jgi:hypothetical protein